MNIREFIKKYDYNLILLVCFICIIFLRLYKLDVVPLGLHIDENCMAYDAWSLSSSGVDRYLKSFPVYLNNSGAGQSILYCLLCVLCYKIMGINVWAIRMPAIIFSVLTLIYGLKLINLCYGKDKKRSILAALLFTLVPYFTQNGRIGLDCNLMLGTFTVFLYYFMKAIKTDKPKTYFLSGILAGVVLYSYIISYVLLPLFLAVTFLYLCLLKKVNWKGILLFCIPFVLLAAPLLLVQIVNIFKLEDIQIGIFSFNKLGFYRSSEFSVSNILPNLFQTIKCMIKDGELIFDAFPQYGTFYMISIPFMFVGGVNAVVQTVKSIKSKEVSIHFFHCCFVGLMVLFGCFLAGDGPLTYRFNAVFFILLLFIVDGILLVIQLAGKHKNKLLAVILVGYSVCFVSFFRYYFYVYPEAVYPQYGFQPTLFEVVDYNEEHEAELQNYNMYLSLNYYTAEYYGLAAQVLPTEFYKNGKRDVSGCRNITFIQDNEENIDKNGCYIVWEVYEEQIDRLREAGFSEEKVGQFIYLRYEEKDS